MYPTGAYQKTGKEASKYGRLATYKLIELHAEIRDVVLKELAVDGVNRCFKNNQPRT